MATKKINNVKQIIGFFSMTLAWALMNILYSYYLTYEYGYADESGVMIFWSGLFITIAWAIFIVFPLAKLNHNKKFLRPIIFPLLTAIYGGLTYLIIVGSIFRSIDLVVVFMPLALMAGFIFGLLYSLLIKSEKFVGLIYKRPSVKLIFFFSPAILLGFFLWFLPTVAPSLVFRYMPDAIRDKIVTQTIPKFKVGDNFESLRKSLPGYFENGSCNMSESMPNFAFILQVNCGKIIRLDYGKTPKDFNDTIYGKLDEQPCPPQQKDDKK